jgi:HlyD family secretion protein
MTAIFAKWRKWIWWAIGAAILLALIALSLRQEPVSVDTASVTKGPLRETIIEEGRTRVKEVFTVSAPVSGRLLRIDSHPGDPVTAGQTVVATIEPADPSILDIRSRAQAEANVKAAEAALALAEAEQGSARAELDFASSELRRVQTLADRGTTSRAEVDRKELAYRTSQSRVHTAEAAVRVRAFELETARAMLVRPQVGGDLDGESESPVSIPIRAPESGRVLRVLEESEKIVLAGTPVIEIGNPADLEILVELLSSDAVKVKEGADVDITGWGGGKLLKGKVRRVEPFGFTKISALGVEEQRVNCIVDLSGKLEERGSLGHGYRVDTEIVTWQASDVIQVPLGALFREGGKWNAFVVEKGAATLRALEVGHLSRESAEIVSGLGEGERVVLHPSDVISDGVPISERPDAGR